MGAFRTLPSILHEKVSTHPSLAALQVPVIDADKVSWERLSFADFSRDVDKRASYWAITLSRSGVRNRSVVGLWLEGTSYSDLLHLWGLMRAGHIPQLISIKLTDPAVVHKLLTDARASALIYDARFHDAPSETPIPVFSAETPSTISQDLPLAPLWVPDHQDEIVMVYHTSGSTSGIPKLVTMTARAIENMIVKSSGVERLIPSTHDQQVMISIGSFSHAGNGFLLVESICRGACFTLPTKLPYPVTELQQAIEEYGLTRLNMFPSILSGIIRAAQQDESLLASLRKLDCIVYGGGCLDATQEAWARAQGLRFLNMFGSTELGWSLASDASSDPVSLPAVFSPVTGFQHEFIYLDGVFDDQGQLLELVVPPESPDCPVETLRSAKDGKFHTGDLFIEVSPGKYLSRGRNDDWIKMEMALRCDTAAIESNAAKTCGDDLISAVIVVGEGRPSPAMVVELHEEFALNPYSQGRDSTSFDPRKEILQRTRQFHKGRYMHERIDDERLILVVSRGSLPRTGSKGNIRRREVERLMKSELDEAYNQVKGATGDMTAPGTSITAKSFRLELKS